MAAASSSISLSVGRSATLACLLEVCASKAGNVHRGADFEDLTFNDFLVSAEILGQAIDARESDGVGQLILAAVESTSVLVGSNTNLGISLLVCPLAILANQNDRLNQAMVRRLLKTLTSDDARLVYQAIARAKPGGLGTSESMDVAGEAPKDILSAMEFSSDRDQIALQYSNGFQQVFDDVVPLLKTGLEQFGTISNAIIYTQISMLARYGDSLIERKCGRETRDEAQRRACTALTSLIDKDSSSFFASVADLDFWMRSDGHRRNPGTTADLIAAGLFVAIINEEISAPFS